MPSTEEMILSRTRKPSEIYHFWNENKAYHLTGGDVSVVYNGDTYTPASIGRGSNEQSLDLSVSKMTIQADYLQASVAEYLGSAPLELTFVEVRRVFRNQFPKDGLVVFIGVIGDVGFKGMSCQIGCMGIERLLRQPIPKMRYQAACQLTLYGTLCGVDKASYGVAGTVVSVAANGLSFVVTEAGALDSGYFNLGFVAKSGSPARLITSHSGTTIQMSYGLPGLVATDSVILYPGCDKLMSTCKDKFNNMANPALDRFFGFPYIPIDNPTMWLG